jgi:hypothetical protein
MNAARTLLFALAFPLAIAGCEKRDPVADEADNAAGLPSIAKPAPSADGAPPANASATAPAADAAAAAIPAALHGRWGLTPADCTSALGDAKGLLVVSATDLRFFESRAVPARNISKSSNSIGADFDFTGEGQSWTKFQTLQLKKDKLVRTESSPMASFTYARCK